jgi:hypothetical protein
MKTAVVFKKIYFFNGENPIVEINAIFPEHSSTLVNGELINFGMKRGSTTNGYILYLVSDSDNEPKEINPEDTQEVGFKWWAKLSTVLNDYPTNKWMIFDHKKFIPDAIKKTEEFDKINEMDMKNFIFSI